LICWWNKILCYFFQHSVEHGTDIEDSQASKPSGKRQQKPSVLPGLPLTKIRIFFASQTGTSKVPYQKAIYEHLKYEIAIQSFILLHCAAMVKCGAYTSHRTMSVRLSCLCTIWKMAVDVFTFFSTIISVSWANSVFPVPRGTASMWVGKIHNFQSIFRYIACTFVTVNLLIERFEMSYYYYYYYYYYIVEMVRDRTMVIMEH